MCLLLENNPVLEQAAENIHCWKILYFPYSSSLWFKIKHNLGSQKNYFTACMHKPVKLGTCVYPEVTYSKFDLQVLAKTHDKIDVGFIHSFADKEEVLREFEHLLPNHVIVECIIPKDAYFFRGEQWGISGYASTELIYKKIIKRLSCW